FVVITAVFVATSLSACGGGVSVGAGASGSGGSGAAASGTGGGAGGGKTDCERVEMLDRSCTATPDCIAVLHTTDCCGSASWIGIRSTDKARFTGLESVCDASYPGCGCASGAPTTDDGSSLGFGTTAGVICAAGVCSTFSPACGGP